MLVPRRPVIAGFHPDPSICRVEDTYFLVNSSFEYAPGVPLFSSRDLSRWTPLTHVMGRPDQLHIDGALPSGGIYAPTLRHHHGLFWMVTTNVSDPPGQIFMTAVDPRGPWSKPVRVPDARGIDPDLAWDADGTCWLTWSGELTPGDHSIVQARLDTRTGELLSEPKAIWRGTGGQYPEGPHLYERNGTWYLLIAEGGTERGHAVTVARGPAPDGPFESDPGNPLLTARGMDWSVQNTGHADLVQRPDGRWAMVFLGVRPHGMTRSWHVLGRETFATEIRWEDGWPRIGTPIEPPAFTSTEVEDLTGPDLPFSWVAPSRWPGETLGHRDGVWYLTGRPGEDTFVGRRQEHFFTRTSARLAAEHGGAGLQIRIDPYHKMTVWYEAGEARAFVTIDGMDIEVGRAAAPGGAVLELRTEAPGPTRAATRLGPDEIVAGFCSGGRFWELGRVDGRYISTEVAGGFTGRMIGVAATSVVGIEQFRYEGSDDPA